MAGVGLVFDGDIEVTCEVSPDGVDVIGVVLGIVVFDDEGFSLDDVVVSAVWFGITPPADADVIHAGFFDGLHAIADDLSGHGGEVFADELFEHFLLVGGHICEAESDGLIDGGLREGGTADVIGCFVGDPHLFFLLFVAGEEDAASEVFASGEDSELSTGSGIDESGVNPDHFGGAADDDAIADDEVEGEVVSFEAPAPGAFGSRGAEEGNVIFVCMSSFAAVVFFSAFEEVEDFFEAADLEGFGVSGGGESGFDEFFGGGASGAVEVAEDDAVAFFGYEVPVKSFGVIEIVGEFFLLFGW